MILLPLAAVYTVAVLVVVRAIRRARVGFENGRGFFYAKALPSLEPGLPIILSSSESAGAESDSRPGLPHPARSRSLARD